MAAAVKPNSIPIGPCGGKGEPACPPIICIKGADGKMYSIVFAAQITVKQSAPEPQNDSA